MQCFVVVCKYTEKPYKKTYKSPGTWFVEYADGGVAASINICNDISLPYYPYTETIYPKVESTFNITYNEDAAGRIYLTEIDETQRINMLNHLNVLQLNGGSLSVSKDGQILDGVGISDVHSILPKHDYVSDTPIAYGPFVGLEKKVERTVADFAKAKIKI